MSHDERIATHCADPGGKFESFLGQEEEMVRSSRFLVLASLTVAFMLVLASPMRMQAQENLVPSTIASIDPYLMDRDAEIAMARSAGPNSISSGAKVLVLGRHGYEMAVEGTNGFVCLVGRSWALPKDNRAFWDPKIHGPICLTAPGARSYLPIYLKQTELAIAGRSSAQIEDAIVNGIVKGELPTPEPGSLSYMMSKQGYLNDYIKGPWLPHVMVFVPEIDPKSLGSNMGDDVPLGAHEEKIGRYTTIEIPVSHWSDGTPSPQSSGGH